MSQVLIDKIQNLKTTRKFTPELKEKAIKEIKEIMNNQEYADDIDYGKPGEGCNSDRLISAFLWNRTENVKFSQWELISKLLGEF